ncbi:MAG: pyridoxal-phosphate dependent enzyme [Bacteroidota bacterium]
MLPKLEEAASQAELLATHAAISPFVHRTPVLTSQSIDDMLGASCYFKCENFQKIGAFKMRGGASAALRLSESERLKGLATHSSGNHAQAVASAAKAMGIPAYIVMPEDAPKVKIEAVRGYGAEITFCPNTPEDRQAELERVVARTGAAFIHPFDDYGVIAGQATAAMELIEQAEGKLDVIMCPVGGGGLLAGTALAAHYFSPGTKVLAGEPEKVDDAYRSFQSGRVERNLDNRTVADGLRTTLSDKTLGVIREHVEDIWLVSEQEIIDAMRLVWERMKIIIEPSCSVPLAAALKHKDRLSGLRIGIILTGGNVDVNKLPF